MPSKPSPTCKATASCRPDLPLEKAQKNYIKAANKGILKVASKMGIATVQSYRGAQIFEAVGLSRELVDTYFIGTPSRIQGIGLNVIQTESLIRHRRAYPPIVVESEVLDVGGQYQYRRHGEYHQWNPDTVAKLQHAVRVDSFKNVPRVRQGAQRRIKAPLHAARHAEVKSAQSADPDRRGGTR